MAPKPLPSKTILLALLDYDPVTGSLTWKARGRALFVEDRLRNSWNARFAGKPALTSMTGGYRYGAILGERYLAHRVIFKMMTGRDPVGIDHDDGDTINNTWANLYEADQPTNCKNKAMRLGGVYARAGKWRATIRVEGRSINIGTFNTRTQAVSARKAAEKSLGFHPNHGRQV